MLKKSGHEVVWLDGIASGLSYEDFLKKVAEVKPDVLALETKTPVVKRHWQIIDKLKQMAHGSWPMATVLFGDHVTALPEESFLNSSVDYVLTGGDYDFLLLNLCSVLNRRSRLPDRQEPTIDYRLFEPGIWYRDNGQVKNTGLFKLDHDLDFAPVIDRDLTQWKLYAYKNGNFKRTPGAYIMAGRDCWWGKCSFCSWPTLYPEFRARKPINVVDEIEGLINDHGVKEIMDDSGCFPAGNWLNDFCEIMIKRGLGKRINLDCNMRFGALSLKQYKLMKKAGFRLVLFGLESANQVTLDRINKNVKAEVIIDSCKMARQAGLYPHITIMFGYPWETYEDALRTLDLGRWLLKKGFAYTVQATIVIPYPGSRLFDECRDSGLLKSLDWDDYDMKSPVMRTDIDDSKIMSLVKGVYSVAFDPEFIVNRIISIRDISDLSYFFRGIKKVSGHLFDFNKTHN